jgi:hypothetical protein
MYGIGESLLHGRPPIVAAIHCGQILKQKIQNFGRSSFACLFVCLFVCLFDQGSEIWRCMALVKTYFMVVPQF